MLILSMNLDKTSLETEFLIAICRQSGDKWQSKTLFLEIYIHVRRLLRVLSIATYPVWALYSRTLVAFNVLSTCDFGRLTQIIMKYRVTSLCFTPIFLIASFYTMICRMQFPVFNVTWIFLWQTGNSGNKLLIILLLRKETLVLIQR